MGAMLVCRSALNIIICFALCPFFRPQKKQSVYHHFFPSCLFIIKHEGFFFFPCLIWISPVGRLTPERDPDAYQLYLDRGKEPDPSATYFTVKPGRIGSDFLMNKKLRQGRQLLFFSNLERQVWNMNVETVCEMEISQKGFSKNESNAA